MFIHRLPLYLTDASVHSYDADFLSLVQKEVWLARWILINSIGSPSLRSLLYLTYKRHIGALGRTGQMAFKTFIMDASQVRPFIFSRTLLLLLSSL